jgi:hypothetical protein
MGTRLVLLITGFKSSGASTAMITTSCRNFEKLIVSQMVKKFPLRNLKVHYNIHESLPLDLVLSHMNLAHTLFKILFNIVIFRSPKWSLSFMLSV